MRQSPKLRPTPWDAVAAFAVIALAVCCAAVFWRAGGDAEVTAVISVDGVETERITLADTGIQRTIQSNGYTLYVRAENGEIWVEQSDCPTQDCVHTGHIARSGRSIVCVPARVVITLEGGGSDGADLVVG